MEMFLPELRKYYYDPGKYKIYLEQLGIQYPTVRKSLRTEIEHLLDAGEISRLCGRSR